MIAHLRKPLTGWTADNAIQLAAGNGVKDSLLNRRRCDIAKDEFRPVARVIEFKRCARPGVNIRSSDGPESGLAESL